MAVSPSAAEALQQMDSELDVTVALPAIDVPCLVLRRSGDRLALPSASQSVADSISGARPATATPAPTDLVPYYTKSAPVCPGGGTYTLNQMDQLPVCSIGGTPGDYDAHVLP